MQVASTGVPYWFLPEEGGAVSPATYEEMAETTDNYDKVRPPLQDGLASVEVASKGAMVLRNDMLIKQ